MNKYTAFGYYGTNGRPSIVATVLGTPDYERGISAAWVVVVRSADSLVEAMHKAFNAEYDEWVRS
jgi:hypothetical protein